MPTQLLLIEDVDHLGRSGDVVTVKQGFARNYLVPQKKAWVANKHTLKMQARLQEARAKQAVVDKQEAELLAERLKVLPTQEVEVKVDPEGHMYGSVSPLDIVHLLEKQAFQIEKRNVVLSHPIRKLGTHTIELRLKEGVECSFKLKIWAEGVVLEEEAPPAAPQPPQDSSAQAE
jgi:large subunit ribosomal protein L9